MLKYIIGAVISIILFVSGILAGGRYYAKTEIKIVEKEVTKTVYKKIIDPAFSLENFNQLNECYKSPLQFGHRQDDNILTVYAEDNCKSSSVKYEVKTRGNYKVYLTFGLIGVTAGILGYHYIKK